VDWAFIGDLQDPPLLLGIERPFDLDHPLDLVKHALLGLAIGTVPGISFRGEEAR